MEKRIKNNIIPDNVARNKNFCSKNDIFRFSSSPRCLVD
jgi:hypothetical protein